MTASTVQDRVAAGKAVRKAVPRSSHAGWVPGQERSDPVAILQQQDEGRLEELLPIRYGRMAVSAFACYRGAAAVMAADLARTPVSGLTVQLCGDAHLSNFGVFASPERALVFDVNDFDETARGPWEWDLKRLVTSFDLAARENGFSDADRSSVVARAARAYREAMAGFAEMTNLDVWYACLDVETMVGQWQAEIDPKGLRRFEKNVARAYRRDGTRAVGRLTGRVDGRLRFLSDPPLFVPVAEVTGGDPAGVVSERLRSLLRGYRRSLATERRHLLDGYRLVDVARKVVGVGSVGTRCWIGLLIGRDDSDVLVLQFKEAGASVLEPYVARTRKGIPHGRRVVEGQRLVQASGDLLLGWDRIAGLDGRTRDFYVRQLWDWKASADISMMRPQGLRIYAEMCGWTLARGHARSGDRMAIAGYLGSSDTMDDALVAFAEDYSQQACADHAALLTAVADGRVTAVDAV